MERPTRDPIALSLVGVLAVVHNSIARQDDRPIRGSIQSGLDRDSCLGYPVPLSLAGGNSVSKPQLTVVQRTT